MEGPSKKKLLAAVFFIAGLPVFCQISGDFEVKNHVLVKYSGRTGDVVIPEKLGINRIGEKAFAGSGITSVKLPVGVGIIENRAFAGCSFLKTVFLPNTLSVIGYRAFFNCTFLETINIPRGLRIVEGGAFFNCRSITEMDMPSTLKLIGPRAFSGCAGMRTLSVSRHTRAAEHAFMGVPPGSIVWKN